MTDGTPQTAPRADWYPDPSTPGQLRFWDGAAWTAHVKPVEATPVMPPPTVAQPLYSQPVLYAAQPPQRSLATRAAGFGMVGILLLAIGIVLAIFMGFSAITIALIVGGAIVFVICLAFCIVFTIQKR